MRSVFLGVIKIMAIAIVISVILLFVGIGILVLIHVCIVGRAFRRGLNSENRTERGGIGNNRNYIMSKEDLEKLPSFEFKAVEKGTSPIDCVVCLENFMVGEKCRLLPICKHSFHAHCVDSWLLKTPICPICRTSASSKKKDMASSENVDYDISRSDEVGSELREIRSSMVVDHLQVRATSSPLYNFPSSELAV